MNSVFILNIIRFIILVLFQVFILNNIEINGYINPYFYVYFILLLPFETPKWLLLTSAFIIGLSIDVFSNSLGINSAACVLIAFLRPGLINVLTSKREFETGIKPGIRDLGFVWFFNYSIILVFIHHFALFFLEAFSFHNFWFTFYQVLASSGLSILLIIFSQYLFSYRIKK
jgi:rod shape-determining protein MreD